MGDIRLDFRNVGSEWERAHRLMEVLPQVGSVDTINITLNRLDRTETGRWLEILEENGFDYQPKGGEEEYYIIARRIH